MQQTGPDGRPVTEYIRDVYADLMAMGEGARRAGDRSDISSDEEGEAVTCHMFSLRKCAA